MTRLSEFDYIHLIISSTISLPASHFQPSNFHSLHMKLHRPHLHIPQNNRKHSQSRRQLNLARCREMHSSRYCPCYGTPCRRHRFCHERMWIARSKAENRQPGRRARKRRRKWSRRRGRDDCHFKGDGGVGREGEKCQENVYGFSSCFVVTLVFRMLAAVSMTFHLHCFQECC